MATYVSGSISFTGSTNTTTDTQWRDWIASIRAALSGVGLVQTSDTGQINPATTTRPGINTNGGYEIWRFSDAAQATDPVFLKITYRVGGAVGHLTLQIATGEGSDGVGNLTGTVTATIGAYGNSSNTANAANGQVYAFFGQGNFWIADGVAVAGGAYGNAPRNYFNIARSRDNSGNLDGRGLFLLYPNYGGASGSNISLFVRRLAGNVKVYGQTSQYCLIVGTRTSDPGVGGAKIAWPHFYYDAGVKQAWATWSTLRSHLPAGPLSFTAAPYGTTRTWLAFNTAPAAHVSGAGNDASWYNFGALVMLWE